MPDPMHPAVVHFPIVFMIVLPLTMLAAFLLARRGVPVRVAWVGVVAASALLAVSSFAAVRSGSSQEERVEEVVPESALEDHEERGEAFMLASVAVLALTSLGLAKGRVGEIGRTIAVLAAIALIPLGALVGHSGGNLVYRHGAATAYATARGPVAVGAERGRSGDREVERDHDRDER
ncbi:MAG: DUF2231 domain-containing protein [Gemmatimonadales bacterium]